MDPGTVALVSAGIGGLGQIFGGKKAKKAAAGAAGEIKRAAAPYVETGTAALPSIRQLVLGQLVPGVTRENPYLEAEHEESLQDIIQQGKQARARSTRFWIGKGNVGRGRGELARLGWAETRARNRENLGYGLAETADRESRIQRAMMGLGMMTNLGQYGTNLSVGGTQTALAGKQAQLEAMMGGLGTMVGGVQGWAENKQWLPILRKRYGLPG